MDVALVIILYSLFLKYLYICCNFQVNFSKKRKNRMRNDEAAIIALSKSRSQYLHKDTDSLVDNEAVIVYDERTALWKHVVHLNTDYLKQTISLQQWTIKGFGKLFNGSTYGVFWNFLHKLVSVGIISSSVQDDKH